MLVCQNSSSEGTIFNLYLDYDKATGSYTGEGGFPITVGANEISWRDPATGDDVVLDRISGQLTRSNSQGSEHALCRPGAGQF